MDQELKDALLWLRYALDDLDTARKLVADRDVVRRHPAWLAQQAAEKALKAILIAERIPFPRTHDLERIRELIPSGCPVKDVSADLERLSEYAVESRYPGDLADVPATQAEHAVEDALKIVSAVREDLALRGAELG